MWTSVQLSLLLTKGDGICIHLLAVDFDYPDLGPGNEIAGSIVENSVRDICMDNGRPGIRTVVPTINRALKPKSYPGNISQQLIVL